MIPLPPPPVTVPPATQFDLFMDCVFLVWLAVSLLMLCLPRPWFCALFKIMYPFMPDRLS